MIGNFNIPNNSLTTQVFYSNETTTSWQTWLKPIGCSFVHFTVIGGGGGGANGRINFATSGGGGGGGGSAAYTTGLFPASVLPDTLYIQVGKGGNRTGGNGQTSYISIDSNITAINVLLSAAGGSGGQTTASAAGGAGGAGGVIFSQTILSYLGSIEPYAGQNGAAGGAAVGTNITVNSFVTGGAGGGGVSGATSTPFSGGSITAYGYVQTVSGGLTGTTGSDGYRSFVPSINLSNKLPLLFTGGAGGGAGLGLALTESNGGNGAYGSGGGGGGAVKSTSGGIGGRGGDGLVIITCL